MFISTYKAHINALFSRPYLTSLNPSQFLNLTTALLTINKLNLGKVDS